MASKMIPDGDGGFVSVDDARTQFSDGSSADSEKQTAILAAEAEKASWERVGAAAEYFNTVHKVYATDHGLKMEEFVKAVYLELLNCKEFYPKDLGGPDKFDEYSKEAFAWFEAHKGD